VLNKLKLLEVIMTQKVFEENIAVLREKLKQRLIAYRYSNGSYRTYMRIFGWLEKFISECGETVYTPKLGYLFIAEYRFQTQLSPHEFNRAKVLVQRLDEILSGKSFTLRLEDPKPTAPRQFREWHEKYCEHLRQVGSSESTLRSHTRYTRRILESLAPNVTSYDALSAAHVYDYFVNGDKSTNQSYSVVRRFFSYLHKNGVTKENLSLCVPSPRAPKPLPSIYDSNEIESLIAAVDRTNPVGKRDYAIMLLASHLGLRSSDIVNLTPDNVNLETKTISIVQVKTGNPVKLVMNTEVEKALSDYINNGRLQSAHDKIFLSSRAPFMPIKAATCFAVTRKYFGLSGIATQGRRRGPHALRASYATALVTKGVPYPVAQKALGHENIESLKYYVRIDAKRLRNCALDVPKPSGAFAALIGDLAEVTV